jgi:hypothetical protein
MRPTTCSEPTPALRIARSSAHCQPQKCSARFAPAARECADFRNATAPHRDEPRGIRGFIKLYEGALRGGATGHYMHHLYNVCAVGTLGGPVNGQDLVKILEMFDDLATSGYCFTQDATDLAKWTSPVVGVVYKSGSSEGHRLIHLITHFTLNPPSTAQNKAHGLFTGLSRPDIYQFVDGLVTNWSNLTKVQVRPGVWHIHIGPSIGRADNLVGSGAMDLVQGYRTTEWVEFIHKGPDPRGVVTVYPVNVTP